MFYYLRFRRGLFVLGLCLFMVYPVLGAECLSSHNETSVNDGIEILVLLSKNFGLNYFLMRDVFDQYGWRVVQSGVLDSITACPPVYEQIGVHPVIPDIHVSQIGSIHSYDAVVIPPGAGSYNPVSDSFEDLLHSRDALDFIIEVSKADIPLYATCAGVQVPAAAGLLKNKNIVGSDRFENIYTEAGAIFLGKDHPPSIDGHLVTSARGLYYNVVNCQAIATVIERRQPRGEKDRIAESKIKMISSKIERQDAAWAIIYGSERSDGCRAIGIVSSSSKRDYERR